MIVCPKSCSCSWVQPGPKTEPATRKLKETEAKCKEFEAQNERMKAELVKQANKAKVAVAATDTVTVNKSRKRHISAPNTKKNNQRRKQPPTPAVTVKFRTKARPTPAKIAAA